MIARAIVVAASCLAIAGCRPATRARPIPAPAPDPRSALMSIVPQPASLDRLAGEPFVLDSATRIVVDSGRDDLTRIGELLAAVLRPSTGFAIPVTVDGATSPNIVLRVDAGRAALGAEGYELIVARDSIRVTAFEVAGAFRAVQTLRQLLPARIESHIKLSESWRLPPLRIVDQPRFPWRGAMLDVARHFFTVDEVKQYIDLLALYKLNVLHLHLADDQGWRIEITSRPSLAVQGGATQVGGGTGGFYTQDDYREIVRYARDRYITVVPEIDMPGHTNAALVSHPQLSCSRRVPALYTGIEVGWSALCPDREETYALIDDVVREIAALTPGAYFHMGGDEVEVLTPSQYIGFVDRVQGIVAKYGKRTIGWEEIAKATMRPGTIAQLWRTDSIPQAAIAAGVQVVMSPGARTYLDMKYDGTTELGLRWAGLLEVRTVYEWDPATYMKGSVGAGVLGVEAPLWSETIRNMTAAQYLAVPRLPALAEVGWTPQARRDWESFRVRLAAHAPRWTLLGINFYRSPQIPW
jgi:hexosaminidase